MKKYLYFLLLPLLCMLSVSCNKDDEPDDMDVSLIPGQWEAVGEDHFAYACIYNFENIINPEISVPNIITYYIKDVSVPSLAAYPINDVAATFLPPQLHNS